ncbi:hypothetical protein GCM10010401_07690 [Rarobacter faecitabidus]|uniref:Nitroreductase family protein n=1 Tax=Rarobacter faecitabidus TaxID=13243 RepID=A0A542ZAL8_RARFA|nr:hypothetical protein [Rarobacter faecitabidus]TQL57376.1 hypothetical protein FB461_2110 [Rarobacter faecitabidus]
MPLPTPWSAILPDARRYPSPHNSQPIKVRVIDQAVARVYYDLDLGLPAENFGIPFAHVCAGVFLETLTVAAAGHGYRAAIQIVDQEMDFGATSRLHPLALVTLSPEAAEHSSTENLTALRTRRTSRRPYQNRLVDSAVIERVTALAAAAGQSFDTTSDQATVDTIIRVNQETLFDDLQNDAVHEEILTWIRTSKSRAATTGDGLSAETMLMPGPILGFAMRHREIWQWPLIGALIRGIYLRTMRGVRQLGWLTGDFGGPADYMRAGRAFMRIWLAFERAGVSLHPFGTVITNPKSHHNFVTTVGADEPPGTLVWMLFRFGYSKTPPLAHRRPLESMLIEHDPGPLPDERMAPL